MNPQKENKKTALAMAFSRFSTQQFNLDSDPSLRDNQRHQH
jgi:hypothetical protein